MSKKFFLTLIFSFLINGVIAFDTKEFNIGNGKKLSSKIYITENIEIYPNHKLYFTKDDNGKVLKMLIYVEKGEKINILIPELDSKKQIHDYKFNELLKLDLSILFGLINPKPKKDYMYEVLNNIIFRILNVDVINKKNN